MGSPSARTDTAGVAPAGIMPEVLSRASWCCTFLGSCHPLRQRVAPKGAVQHLIFVENKWRNGHSMGTPFNTHLTPPGSDLPKCSGMKKWSGLQIQIHVDNGIKEILRWDSPSNSSATGHLCVKLKNKGWETRLDKHGGVRQMLCLTLSTLMFHLK